MQVYAATWVKGRFPIPETLRAYIIRTVSMLRIVKVCRAYYNILW